ncbi:MAG TPA: sensor histidine kinase N-terminal domain-containing protein, partial [Burkholderiaceae bacterium]
MLPPIHAEPVAEAPSHWGIRARLLALLLPGIAALLAFDSWNDYRALVRTTESAYDQALLEPVFALDDAITLDRQGEVDLS